MTKTRKAILLAWNMQEYPNSEVDSESTQSDQQARNALRFDCKNVDIDIGDDIYLIPAEPKPLGIVAKGIITGKTAAAGNDPLCMEHGFHIDVRINEMRPDCASGLVPITLLARAFESQTWSAQQTGLQIDDTLLPKLEQLWDTGKGKHSLRQFFEYVEQGRNEEDFLGYEEIVGLAKSIRNKERPLDDAALFEIWKNASNGVAPVAPAFLSDSDFDNNRPLLTDFMERIFSNPDVETMQYVKEEWKQAVEQKKFRVIYHSVLNRVFSACAPDLFTTILNFINCKELLDVLSLEFQLNASNVPRSNDWIGANAAIKQCMKLAGIPSDRPLENNFSIYQLIPKPKKINHLPPKRLSRKSKEKPMISVPLNQILFGPPGTGKTYSIVEEALRILDPTSIEGAPTGSEVARADRLRTFNEFIADGRIVVCTFHQSFSYEDFVEGLTASANAGQIEYAVKPGIFKMICQKAKTASETGSIGTAERSSNAVENKKSQTPYVLIIDEINRGSISKIFGELITLIESSKRSGSPEALSITLPYSKEQFSVPDNLYLIGTMNSSDRSLAGLDIALRRRFTFKEVPPRPELLDDISIDGVNVGKLLRKMNERIEILLDRDHCIGHAYFIPLKGNQNLTGLKFIFRQQILPLLQEYFFEDWERIAWVLNDQNKQRNLAFVQKSSTDLVELFGTDTSSNLNGMATRWHINEAAFDNIASYRAIAGDTP